MFALLLSEGMDPFYQNIASFPTAIFTFLLGVVTLYWLVAVLGVVDIDVLDFDIPDADGGLGVNSDSGVSTPDALAGIMLKIGLHGVPVTIIVSFISLFGWLCCYYLAHFLLGHFPEGILRYLTGIPIFFGSLFVAVMITAVVIKPLRPLFKKAQQHTEKLVLGQSATVRTSKVDNDFGEATLDDGGAGLILKVRSSGDSVFKKGDKVVLLEYMKENNVYRVISEDEFSGL
ncbi:MAG: DUF1449 domain-containing protein [Gammaproteobacteria bacterium]|nr:DUF1449 domain-containing protein [Gammaproteobacteria bacterium]